MVEETITIELPTSGVDIKTINLPRNYTLFIDELKRIALGGSRADNSPVLSHIINHGMTQDEYDRFVNDMWIGIILTLLMLFIVFSLCFWYMFHKFQHWRANCKFFILLHSFMYFLFITKFSYLHPKN